MSAGRRVCRVRGRAAAQDPAAESETTFTELHEAAVVVRRNGRVLVRQCAEGERWAGLWDFPRFALEAEGPLFAREEIEQRSASRPA